MDELSHQATGPGHLTTVAPPTRSQQLGLYLALSAIGVYAIARLFWS